MLAVINRIRKRLKKKHTQFFEEIFSKDIEFLHSVGNGVLSSHSNMADGEVGLSGETYSDLPSLRSRQLRMVYLVTYSQGNLEL